MFVSPPGAPVDCITCTPAALPCNAWSKEVTGTAFSSSDFTEETAPVISDFLTVPYPITTNSDKDSIVGTRVTSTVD